ncbi:MAG: RNA polymerase sigma factor [Chloroflexota bacterium]
MDQRTLVDQARRGDHEAFAVLVRERIARLDAAARLILRDAELARDAVQEALMRAWRDLPGLRDLERFDAWLHRLLTHCCIDAARARRRRMLEIELLPEDGPSIGDPSALIAQRDLLEGALGRLQPDARALVVLVHYLGLTVPDAADALGIPLGTAKSRLSRTLAAMRVSMDPGDRSDPARRSA